MASIPRTPVHRARSRDHFRTSKLSRVVCGCLCRASQPAAQFWPERLRSHVQPLGTRYRTYLGMVRPRARPDRSKWLHGSPVESDMVARCRRLQLGAAAARKRDKGCAFGSPLQASQRAYFCSFHTSFRFTTSLASLLAPTGTRQEVRPGVSRSPVARRLPVAQAAMLPTTSPRPCVGETLHTRLPLGCLM